MNKENIINQVTEMEECEENLVYAYDKNGKKYEVKCEPIKRENLFTIYDFILFEVNGDERKEIRKETKRTISWLEDAVFLISNIIIEKDTALDGYYAYLEDTTNDFETRIRFMGSKPNILPVKYIVFYCGNNKEYGIKIEEKENALMEHYSWHYNNSKDNVQFLTLANINYGKIFDKYEEGKEYLERCYDEMANLLIEFSENYMNLSIITSDNASKMVNMKNNFVKSF